MPIRRLIASRQHFVESTDFMVSRTSRIFQRYVYSRSPGKIRLACETGNTLVQLSNLHFERFRFPSFSVFGAPSGKYTWSSSRIIHSLLRNSLRATALHDELVTLSTEATRPNKSDGLGKLLPLGWNLRLARSDQIFCGRTTSPTKN